MERVWQPLALSLAEGFLRCHSHLSPDPDKSIPMAFPMDKTRTTQDTKMCRTKAVSPPASCQRDLLARRETASLAFKDASPGMCWGGKLWQELVRPELVGVVCLVWDMDPEGAQCGLL